MSRDEPEDVFSFPCVLCESATCPITADEIFLDGKIRPIFTNSATDPTARIVSKPPVKPATRRSLSRLFTEDKDFDQPSTSSSETYELDGVSRGMYYKWTPQKSSSTGTSKRWKLPRILRRCSSDNRDGLVFYDHSDDLVLVSKNPGRGNETVLGHYASKKGGKDGSRRRSYLPYRHDLIGLFANIPNKPGARKWEPSQTLTS